jgi:hypothetical protein
MREPGLLERRDVNDRRLAMKQYDPAHVRDRSKDSELTSAEDTERNDAGLPLLLDPAVLPEGRRSNRDPDPGDATWWRTATTLRDLGALTARWLEGDITYLPAYLAAGPDPETDALVPFLAAANRAGFVTVWSQPGRPSGANRRQRAVIEGFCDEQLAERIIRGLVATDLVVLTGTSRTTDGPQVPVTLDDGEPFTWAGEPLTAEHVLQSYGEVCTQEAVDALLIARQLCVFDPTWGRDDVLWAELGRAIEIVA